MSLVFALLAAGAAPVAELPEWRQPYAANDIPTTALKLEPKQVCKDVEGEPVQYVDAYRLAFQIIVQFEMYDDLKDQTASARMAELDGKACIKVRADENLKRAGKDPLMSKAEAKRAGAYCNGAIAIQRMLMGVYPGFYTTAGTAEVVKVNGVPVKSKDVEEALKEDIEDLTDDQARIILALTQGFLASTPEDKYVACVFAKPETKVAKADPEVVSRYRTGLVLASGATGLGSVLNAFQFRSQAGNLIYRGDISSLSSAPETWAAGRDIGSTDAGFGIKLDRRVGDEAAKDEPGKNDGFLRTKTFNVQGAIGFPLCGLVNADRKPCKYPGMKIDFDLAPYWAREYEKVGKTVLKDPAASDEPTKSSNREEFGGVFYVALDRDPLKECALRHVFNNVTSCGHLGSVRYSDLKNKADSSHLRSWSARYTPVLSTNPPGFSFWEFCLNKFCGDPDQIVRWGALFDARYSHGDFIDRGVYDDATPLSPKQLEFNRDYDRIGARAGAMVQVNFLPNVPLTVWTAYTRIEPLRGFDGNLDMFQLQTSLDLAPASISLQWRNGRREDTAKRDSSLVLSLGVKTK